jgi:hypothetical protein
MNTITHRLTRSTHTGRGPSPDLWGDCPWKDLLEDPGLGVLEFHDFTSGGLITAPTTHAALVGLPLSGFSSTGSQITYGNPTFTKSDEARGTLVLAETTTRESTSIRSDVVPYRLSADFGKLWFEARFKISTVATNEMSFFVGLFEDETLTVDIPVIAAGADTHLVADKNLVGFKKPVADTTTFDAVYRADGQTAVVSIDGSATSTFPTLAADTYIKVGFKFDPTDQNRLSWFVNNVIQSTKVTVPDNTGTSFPADVPLGWLVGMSVGTAASDNTLTLDWVRVAQLCNS